MPEPSEDGLSLEKIGSWAGVSIKTRDRWLFSILSATCFLTLQTLLTVSEQNVFLTISLYIFAVALPLDGLLVLLTYARKKELHPTVRLCLEWIAAIGTIVAVALALFFHATWVHGVVFFGASLVAGLMALYYVLTPKTKGDEQGADG